MSDHAGQFTAGPHRRGMPSWGWLALAVAVFALLAYGITMFARAFATDAPPAPLVLIATPPSAGAVPSATPPAVPLAVAPPPVPAQTRTVYVVPPPDPVRRPLRLTDLGPKPCAGLGDRGVTYYQMLEYWQQFGRPDSMDVDHDGYPCETVYGNQN